MRNNYLQPFLSAMAAALLLGAPLAAVAATATQNITLNGTISPPPATCSFIGSPALSFVGTYTNQAGPSSGGAGSFAPTYVEATTTIALNCTANTAYSLSAIEWSPVTVGGHPAGVSVSSTNYDELFYAPITGTGSGSTQNINLIGILGGTATWDPLDRTKHFGGVAGTVQLVLTY